MKDINNLCSYKGFITLTWGIYSPRTVFAIVNYLELTQEREPGSQTDKSRNSHYFTAELMQTGIADLSLTLSDKFQKLCIECYKMYHCMFFTSNKMVANWTRV